MELGKFKSDRGIGFLKMPRFIFEMDDLSLNAKFVYMLIFDRIRQSEGRAVFTELNGDVFCFYSDTELAEDLGFSRITAIRAVNELKALGLLHRERTKAKDGKAKTFLSIPLGCIADDTSESRLYQNCDNPSITDDTSHVSQVIQPFPYISKNKDSKNKEKEIEKKSVFNPMKQVREAYKDPDLLDAWKEFFEMRKTIKRPVCTQRAVTGLINKLNNLSRDPWMQAKIVDQSTERCWQSFFPLKEEPKKKIDWSWVDGGDAGNV